MLANVVLFSIKLHAGYRTLARLDPTLPSLVDSNERLRNNFPSIVRELKSTTCDRVYTTTEGTGSARTFGIPTSARWWYKSPRLLLASRTVHPSSNCVDVRALLLTTSGSIGLNFSYRRFCPPSRRGESVRDYNAQRSSTNRL